MTKKISRRKFIKGLGACAAGAAIGNIIPGTLASAKAASNGGRLVVLNLDGGFDTLAIFQPNLGALADKRPTLFRNMSDSSLILPLTSKIGLHSSFGIIKEEFDRNNVALVHKMGYENVSRSHADGKAAYARGVKDRNSVITTGWLNRLGTQYFSNSPFSVFDFTGGNHTTIAGTYRGTALRSLNDFNYLRDTTQNIQENQFRRDIGFSMVNDWPIFQAAQAGNQAAFSTVINSVDRIQSLPQVSGYPNTGLGRQLRDVDRVIGGIPEAQFFYTTKGGFDTHEGQATGGFNDRLTEIDDALRFFINRMKARGEWENTLIYLTSEFSRTITENTSRGTDHGKNTTGVIIGPAVNGGMYGTDYTNAEMAPRYLETLEFNHTNVMSEIIECVGYNPEPIFGPKTQNIGLFT